MHIFVEKNDILIYYEKYNMNLCEVGVIVLANLFMLRHKHKVILVSIGYQLMKYLDQLST